LRFWVTFYNEIVLKKIFIYGFDVLTQSIEREGIPISLLNA
jgi:hypothetical protein